MPIVYRDVAQRSEAWDILRCGIPTSSAFSKILTPTGKLSKQAEQYMDRLLAEWYFGGPLQDPETEYQSAWMERGAFLEDRAVLAYEFATGLQTEKVGFVTTDDGMIGCSPDRFIGDDGVLEIKVPSPKVHMGYMRRRSVDSDYYSQLQGIYYVTGRKFVDIQSYCDPFPSVVIHVSRDDEYISKLSLALHEFVHTMQQARTLIEKTYGPPLRSQGKEDSEPTP